MTEERVRTLVGGINQSGVRAHNERLLLSTLQRYGAMAGSAMARQTGLSPQTASVILRLDDQALIRAGLRAIIDTEPDLAVVGEAEDGRDVVQVVKQSAADVVLMDIHMHHVDGIEATKSIMRSDELTGVSVVVLTTFEVDEYVVAAIRAGASGYLDKGVDADVLVDAIRIVASGDGLMTPMATRALIASVSTEQAVVPLDESTLRHLTAREREVVNLVGLGLSNDEIADRLTLSPLTARTHVSRAMTKLHARDRAQLVTIAFRTGLTQVHEL